MDLFLLNGDTDELSLMDMLDKDLKYSRQDDNSRSNYTSDLLMDLFDTDICMEGHIEPLFDLLPPANCGDEMADSPFSASSTPAASSCCSSSSSLEDDQGRLSMERELSWFGIMEASGGASHKDYNFDVDNAIMVNPSSVLPSTLPSRLHQSFASTNSTGGVIAGPASPASPSTTVSPLLSSTPSPLLSSSPVMLSSTVNNGVVFSSSQVPTSNYQNFVPASSNSNHHPTQTVYIKTEPMQTSVASSNVQLSQQGANTQVTVLRPAVNSNMGNNSTTSTAITPTIIATPRQLTHQQQQQLSSSNLSFSQTQQHRVQVSTTNSTSRTHQTVVAHSSARVPQQQQQAAHHIVSSAGITTVHTTTNTNNGHLFRGKPATVRGAAAVRRPDERVLPKPAYSYSCLIALALKNSTTGSLPVSEIYNFMCEYFPYFRTAPNGWKNSVRHNLSLNKCFEKIEKPVVSGNNQRKGCLWALNPNKVHKMDEEIQKWNKKDLQGIRDAMNTPEVLGALERGEMKFEAANGTSSCSEDEDEDEEVDALTLTDPPTTLATLKFVNGGSHLASRTGMLVQQPRTTLHIHSNKSMQQQPAILARQTSNGGNMAQQQILTASKVRGNAVLTTSASGASPVTSSPSTPHQEPDFILPDSTMTEISFQANGALVDDLGNEISIEEEVTSSSGGIINSNVVASNVSVVSSPRSVVLRKMPLAAMRSPTALRANYVYSPSMASPHQHNLNRLVLTNAKMA